MKVKQLNTSLSAIKNHYETTLEFRHDYKNIIRSLSGFLENEDIHGARDYISEITEYSSSILIPDFYYQLEKMKIIPVQSILASFGEDMLKEELRFTLFIKDDILQLDVDTIDLIRCLSILLTNAKEEVKKQKDGRINVTISKSDDITTFLVRNTLTKQLSLKDITQKGFSTKNDHTGRGLSIIRRITGRYKNFDCTFQNEDRLFSASLEIRNIEVSKKYENSN